MSREERRCLKPWCWRRAPRSALCEQRRGLRPPEFPEWEEEEEPAKREDGDLKHEKTWGSARSTHQAEQQDGTTRDRRSCPPGGLQLPAQGRRWPQRMSDPEMTTGALSCLLHLGKGQGKWGGGGELVPKGGTRNSWQRKEGFQMEGTVSAEGSSDPTVTGPRVVAACQVRSLAWRRSLSWI